MSDGPIRTLRCCAFSKYDWCNNSSSSSNTNARDSNLNSSQSRSTRSLNRIFRRYTTLRGILAQTLERKCSILPHFTSARPALSRPSTSPTVFPETRDLACDHQNSSFANKHEYDASRLLWEGQASITVTFPTLSRQSDLRRCLYSLSWHM